MILFIIATLVAALAFLTWLSFGPPDQDALDKIRESASPYDTPSVSRKHIHHDLARQA